MALQTYVSAPYAAITASLVVIVIIGHIGYAMAGQYCVGWPPLLRLAITLLLPPLRHEYATYTPLVIVGHHVIGISHVGINNIATLIYHWSLVVGIATHYWRHYCWFNINIIGIGQYGIIGHWSFIKAGLPRSLVSH